MSAADGFELWHMLVYWSDRAGGNSTGVVLTPAPLSQERERNLAAVLGFRDTVFLTRSGDAWLPRMYSPAGPLEFCTQTLLAAREVLRLKGMLDASGDAGFLIGEQRVRVGAAQGQPPELVWVHWPHEVNATSAAGEVVVEVGRKRIYRLMDLKALEADRIDPADVLRLCTEHDAKGLCLYAIGPDRIRLRVFTTSLDGHEDAATGGAVLGLAPLLDNRARLDKIEQGHGPPHRRGALYLLRDRDALAVGGRATPIAVGRLASPLPRV